MEGYFFWINVAIPIVIGYFWYVSLVSRSNNAKEALSGIDIQLKKRSNLIPNLLKIAQKFMNHEKTLLTDITELRTKSNKGYDKNNSQAVQSHLAAAGQLAGKMQQLMIAVENYPDLKSDQTMIQAMQSYNEVEAQIAAARRFYNSAVSRLNNSVQIFPGNLIAKMANISSLPFYKDDEAVQSPIDVDSFLKR